MNIAQQAFVSQMALTIQLLSTLLEQELDGSEQHQRIKEMIKCILMAIYWRMLINFAIPVIPWSHYTQSKIWIMAPIP